MAEQDYAVTLREGDPADGGTGLERFAGVLRGDIGGSQTYESVTRAFTSAEILALFTSPIALVAAPGAGFALLPFQVLAATGAGTGYTINVGLQLDPLGVALANLQVGLRDTEQVTSDIPGAAPSQEYPFALVENQPITISAALEDPTDGDADMTLTLIYTVVPFAA